jgi:molybdopterin-guanine dinucleotide biosynthesis protein A
MTPSPAAPDRPVLGVLLAGGRGERLGLGLPKAHAALAGITLYERALTALTSVCARVWVAAPAGMTLPAVGDAGVTRVNDPPDAAGPLAGIAAVAACDAFASAASGAGARFVRIVTLAVDLPLVTGGTLHALLAAYDELASTVSASALIPATGGHLQPLAAVWSPAAFHALVAAFASGERAVVRAAVRLGARTLDDAALTHLGIADEIARDVDTAADLGAVSRRLHDLAREGA